MVKKSDSQTGDLYKKDIPKMPEGYYSGDKPNQNLRAFVEQHLKERPKDPENDHYSVPAFDKPIVTTKNSAVFSMHPYHLGKKPFDAIESYVEHYTETGDIVLDPFSGSGSTAVAALVTGRKSISIDLSPAATFITRFYVTPIDPPTLQKRFESMVEKVADEMAFLFNTRCHRCNGPATIHYVIYSNEYECPRCLAAVTLFAASQYSPPRCPECSEKRQIEEPITSKLRVIGFKPVAMNFSCHGSCRPKRSTRSIIGSIKEREAFEKIDLKQIHEIESHAIPHPYPQHFMMNVTDIRKPWGDEWRPSRNFRKVSDLFTYRNLWAIAALMDAAGGDADLRAVITSGMFAVSRKAQHLDGGGGYIPGNWALPPMSKQRNVVDSLRNVFGKTCEAKGFLIDALRSRDVCISTQSATDMLDIPSETIDYIFTDPPYGGAVQYAELNFLWEAWLGFSTAWTDKEIIVNETRGKTEFDWAEMMKEALSESFRVLKPGRWLTLCYHDTSEGTWALIQDIMAEVGFIVGETDKALYIDTGGNTYNQRVADKVTKRDLVINFRKPKFGEVTTIVAITGDEDETTFNEKVHKIIRDYIGANPGCPKDRIYDEVVSRMVRRGQMEAHNFDELLRQVAEEVKTPIMKNLFEQKDADLFGTHEVGRWFLKETELAEMDVAETAMEDTAAEKLSVFIKGHLKKHLGDEGVHYSDLFENYIYSVKDKPRRHLAEFLPDYFYKTEQGTWRLPDSEEEERAKREARVKGLGRRVKRYIAQLEQGVSIPDNERPNDSTLAEWLRHCKRPGLYEQGKLLYEKGGLNLDNLTEEAMVNVEEDYQVCVRMLARITDKATSQHKRNK